MILENMGYYGQKEIEFAFFSMKRKMQGVRLSVCHAYNAGECHAEECHRMHVCHRYVLDRCPSDPCELSHRVTEGQHNASVLERAHLADESVSHVLQQLAEGLIERPLIIAICRDFYDKPGGCERRCMRLHACPWFIHDRCWYGDGCAKRHNLRDPHNQRALDFFGCTESQALALHAARRGAPADGDYGGDYFAGRRPTHDRSVKENSTTEGPESGSSEETGAPQKQSGGRSEVQRLIDYLEQFQQRRAIREQRRVERQEHMRQVLEKQEEHRGKKATGSTHLSDPEPKTREELLELQVKQLLQKQTHHLRDLARFRKVASMQLELMKCVVCRGIFKRPATLSCGHTFCQACVANASGRPESCPLCFLPVYSKTRCSVLDKLLVSMADMPAVPSSDPLR